MLSPLSVTVATLLLLSTPAAAFPRFRGKHNFPQKPKGEEAAVTTITVYPMPIGTYDGIFYSGLPTGFPVASGAVPTTDETFPTATNIESGIFPPGATGVSPSGSGATAVYPSGTGTGVPFPTFTSPPIIEIPSNSEIVEPPATSIDDEFPEFTSPPIIEIPSPSLEGSTAEASTIDSEFPVFTGTPIVSVPGNTAFPSLPATSVSSGIFPSGAISTGSGTGISLSGTGVFASGTGAVTYPVFTGTPIIVVPSGTAIQLPKTNTRKTKTKTRAKAITTTLSTPLASSPPTLSKFPKFTKAPIIVVPSNASTEIVAAPTPTSVAPTTLSTATRAASLSKFPVFTKAPVVVIPSGTEAVVAPSSVVSTSTTSAAVVETPAAAVGKFPVFTGTPIIDVPAVKI